MSTTVTKKPGTWKALRDALDRLHLENAEFADRVRKLERELDVTTRCWKSSEETAAKYKRRHDETTIALASGVRIANYARLLDPSEITHRVTTAQALGSLVLLRVVEDERDGTRLEMWAHPMIHRTVI